ncbi:DUF2917 domain-containing protein [Deefgea rivuli]|uniref:DUF2917 domain-containing protein n=1 Tax=Deefgea rivuli TaxID=400948 RepID=UPI0004898574|nr:DUF2917 domain-containing protein [Deefgea rivuli]
MQTYQLNTAEVHSLAAKQSWIRCDSGQVWLSHDGEDIVLECGQKCFISGRDKVVVEALQNSRYSLAKDFMAATAQDRPMALGAAATA